MKKKSDETAIVWSLKLKSYFHFTTLNRIFKNKTSKNTLYNYKME